MKNQVIHEAFTNERFGLNFEINNDKKSGLERVPTILITDASFANHSSRLRATCNFSTDGLQYKDYSRAKLAGHDIFGDWVSCQMYEYVNIRGNNCSYCTTLTRQQVEASWHIWSYNSIEREFKINGKA